MKVSSPPVSPKEAIKFADDLETAIGEIANGKRKRQNIPMEPMVALIQYARDNANHAAAVHNERMVNVPLSLLAGLVAIANEECLVGSPNHAHEVPGIWDPDNGELAGKPCAECAMYDLARKIVAENTPPRR